MFKTQVTLEASDTNAQMSGYGESHTFKGGVCCTGYTQFRNLNLKNIKCNARDVPMLPSPHPGSQTLSTCVYQACTGHRGHSETSPEGS